YPSTGPLACASKLLRRARKHATDSPARHPPGLLSDLQAQRSASNALLGIRYSASLEHFEVSASGGSMVNLIAAAAFFVGIHFCISGTRLRDRLVSAIGEKRYRGLFSLLSLA